MKKHKKPLWAALLLVVVAFGVYWFFLRDTTPDMGAERRAEQAADTSTIRLIATGDTIGHDSINAQAKQSDGSYKYLPMMTRMQPFFDGADVRFCNQATPAGGEQFGITGYPVFNAPLAFTYDMVALGCNLVNIGTNHTNDKGQALIDADVGEWGQQDILAYAGANRSPTEKDQVRYFTVKGVKFAFLSYSTYTNSPVANGYGVTMYDKDLADRQIGEAHTQADFVIVSMRWGTEYSPDVNDQQNQISQELADLGTDIIFGHGPHVLEPVKRLQGSGGNETIVWYSLGNFLSSQLEVEALTGCIVVIDIDVASKKFTDIGCMPIYMHYEWTATEKQNEDLLARKDLTMYPLDQAADPLARSQNDTSVEAQINRIKKVLNQYIEVPIIHSSDY